MTSASQRQQFRACIVKHMSQLRKSGLSFVLEVALPIVFVAVTVILWATFGVAQGDPQQFVDYAKRQPLADGSLFHSLRNNLCINASHSSIAALQSCRSSPFFNHFRCFDHVPMVPISGLCCNANTSEFDPPAFVQQVANAGIVGTAAPFEFDDLVLFQWVAANVFGHHLQNREFFSSLAAFNSVGKLHFAPNSLNTLQLIAHFNTTTSLFRHVFGQLFATVHDAESYVSMTNAEQIARDGTSWGLIVVNSLTAENFDVEIRLNHTAMPKTANLVNPLYAGGPNGDNALYLVNGFATLQSIVSRYYLAEIAGIANIPSVAVLPMGFQHYNAQAFLVFGGTLTPLIILLGFLYPVSQLTKRIVSEKELHIREAMFVMGLKKLPFYTSWLAANALVTIVSALSCTVLLKLTFLLNSDPVSLYFTFWLFELSTVTFAGLMSSFFHKARVAATVAPVIFFLAAAPIYAMGGSNVALKAGLLPLSPTAFSEALLLFFQREIVGGLGERDVASTAEQPNVLTILLALAADTVVYGLLWVYLDEVLPSEGGVSRPWHFPLSDLLANRTKVRSPPPETSGDRKDEGESDVAEQVQSSALSGNGQCPPHATRCLFENRLADKSPSVQVTNLCKSFVRRGEKVRKAVDNLTLSFYEGEISVLLGHNGAGKTTTVSMLTGRLEPDSGDCIVYGQSVRTSLDAARGQLGICPQHNILWSELSCEEHLKFFGTIKGLDGSELDSAIEIVLSKVGLSSKRPAAAGTLSGGQKRKLSLAIAFIGGSKFIILDEPTAGMDVTARRQTWDLLREEAKEKTILLTTHYMDEADLLGDQISIMQRGKLFCSGSSTFLKTHLDVGYTLELSYKVKSTVNQLKKAVWNLIPRADVTSTGAGLMAMHLPSESLPLFPQLLALFESDKQISSLLGDGGFSISAPTLEDVFLRVDRAGVQPENEGEEMPLSRKGSITQSLSSMWHVETLESNSSDLALTQLAACLVSKRFKYATRDRRSQCFQIVLPVVCISVAMLLSLIQFVSLPSIVLSSDSYQEQVEIQVTNCDAMMDVSRPFGMLSTFVSPRLAVNNTFNLSTALMNSANGHGWASRYSAFACNDSEMSLQILEANVSIVFHNFSAPHSLIIGLADFYSGIYRKGTGSSRAMRIVNNPMPLTKNEGAYWDSIRSITIAVIIMIPFTFIPSTFVSWVVQERECGARHQQTIAGLPFALYWLSNFIFDFGAYMVTTLLTVCAFLIFNRTEYISSQNVGATVVLFIVHGFSSVAFTYAISNLFAEHSSAQNSVMLLNFVAGFLLVLLVFILDQGIDNTAALSQDLRFIFRLVPSFCLGDGIVNLALLQLQESVGGNVAAWDMIVCGWDIVYLSATFPLYLAAMLLMDGASIIKEMLLFRTKSVAPEQDTPSTNNRLDNEDEFVARERLEVENAVEHDREDDAVLVQRLRKVFPDGHVGVDNISFGVHQKEIFCLLGVNGAGKTTTLSILSQKVKPSSGSVSIAGIDVVSHGQDALRIVGYCPQFDALFNLLTVDEHLNLFARIRGIDEDELQTTVDYMSNFCHLSSYRTTLAGELSGGNRRKLSLALALIGCPKVVFLDEPSAGMDPVARRELWDVIHVVATQCAIILTTHHLEEVEALAHRVAILQGGVLHRIGDKLSLKKRFGAGFELTVCLKTLEAAGRFEDFILEHFPYSNANEVRGRRYVISLPHSVQLSAVFGRLEQNKLRLGIADYSLAQTSIEQVLLQASTLIDSTGEEKSPGDHNRSLSKRLASFHRRNPQEHISEQ